MSNRPVFNNPRNQLGFHYTLHELVISDGPSIETFGVLVRDRDEDFVSRMEHSSNNSHRNLHQTIMTEIDRAIASGNDRGKRDTIRNTLKGAKRLLGNFRQFHDTVVQNPGLLGEVNDILNNFGDGIMGDQLITNGTFTTAHEAFKQHADRRSEEMKMISNNICRFQHYVMMEHLSRDPTLARLTAITDGNPAAFGFPPEGGEANHINGEEVGEREENRAHAQVDPAAVNDQGGRGQVDFFNPPDEGRDELPDVELGGGGGGVDGGGDDEEEELNNVQHHVVEGRRVQRLETLLYLSLFLHVITIIILASNYVPFPAAKGAFWGGGRVHYYYYGGSGSAPGIEGEKQRVEGVLAAYGTGGAKSKKGSSYGVSAVGFGASKAKGSTGKSASSSVAVISTSKAKSSVAVATTAKSPAKSSTAKNASIGAPGSPPGGSKSNKYGSGAAPGISKGKPYDRPLVPTETSTIATNCLSDPFWTSNEGDKCNKCDDVQVPGVAFGSVSKFESPTSSKLSTSKNVDTTSSALDTAKPPINTTKACTGTKVCSQGPSVSTSPSCEPSLAPSGKPSQGPSVSTSRGGGGGPETYVPTSVVFRVVVCFSAVMIGIAYLILQVAQQVREEVREQDRAERQIDPPPPQQQQQQQGEQVPQENRPDFLQIYYEERGAQPFQPPPFPQVDEEVPY